MSDKRPFPPPPFSPSRQAAPEACPFGPPTPVERSEQDERMKDQDIQLLFKQYLRPAQQRMEIYRFILNFLTHRNAAQAAREAGLASHQGGYLRQRPEIHACIDAITARNALKYGYDAEEVIERTKEIVNIDPAEMQNPDGSFKSRLTDIRPEVRRAIRKFKAKNLFGKDANDMPIVVGQLIEVEFWDKMKGIELLGSEKNIYKKTTVVQHDVTNNMKDVLLESGNRAEERMRLLEARDVQEEDDGQIRDSEASDSDGGREGD